MIGKCKCQHAGQDALHGVGRRVLNEHITKNKDLIRRCTVCGNETSTRVVEKAKDETVTAKQQPSKA